MTFQRFELEIPVNFHENSAHALFRQLWTSQAEHLPLCSSVQSVFSPAPLYLDPTIMPSLNWLPDFNINSKTKKMNKQESCMTVFFLRNLPFMLGL